jgi:pyruvate/2-oxoglutarate dehydrogenase complex dihydrolipoamide dehydrogenase (E3) component
MTETHTDVVVLGVGTCGEDLSLRLLRAGLSVVGIEASLVGGECPYWACLPTKMMIRAANAVAEARRVDALAGRADVTPSWAPVAARVSTESTGGWDDAVAVQRFADRGGRLIHGRGKLVDQRTVEVEGQRIVARIGVVIATGSRPTIPPIEGLSDVPFWTTHDAIAAETLPSSMTVLGGGAVGCEISQVFSRFGVAVTIVEGRDRLLAAEEPEASAVVEAALAADGVTIMTGVHARRARMADGDVAIDLDDGRAVNAERLLVATGRHVDLTGLGLESVGIDTSGRAIPVDDRMRAADGVWAMGDVTGGPMFTHMAMHQAAIVGADILGLRQSPTKSPAVPRVTFTDPEVGAVGMTEAQARDAGVAIAVVSKSLDVTFRGWLHATGAGVVKLIVDRSTGLLVGATTAGPQGGEMLGMLSLAMHAKIPIHELQAMVYAFPTFHGGVGEAIGAYGRGLTTVFDPDYTGVGLLDEVVAGYLPWNG